MNFAFIADPAKTGDDKPRIQVTSNMTCREIVNEAVRQSIRSKIGHWTGPHQIDMDKLRLLFVYSPLMMDEFKRRLFNGKAALNLLERIAGWEESKITTVKHGNYKNAWLITGPKQWMSQPQMLSLATWVLRLAAKAGPIDVENYDDFEAWLRKLSERAEDNSDNDKGVFIKNFWDKVYLFVKYHDVIFKDMDIKTAWDAGVSGSFGCYSGLLTFVNGTASYSDAIRKAYTRYCNMKTKHLPRNNKKFNN